MIRKPPLSASLNILRAKRQDLIHALTTNAITVNELKDAQRVTLGIYLQDEAIGYISARLEDAHWPKPNEFKMNPIGRYQIWYSLAFAIDPEHWEKGLTDEAVTAFKDFIVSTLKPNGLHVQFDPRNQNAAKLFTSMGFTRAASMDGTEHFILVLR